MPADRLLLYACGSDLIVDFVEVCRKNGVEIAAVLRNVESGDAPDIDMAPVAAADYEVTPASAPFLVPLFTPQNRYRASREALGRGLVPFALLSDRNNDLPDRFAHGVGCFINKRVVIGANSRMGDFVLVNRGACLGHHLVLEDYASIGPGVVTGGGVTVKRGALVGTGAVVLPKVTIGGQAVVGAGAVVTRDVEEHSVVIGNPARPVKRNDHVF